MASPNASPLILTGKLSYPERRRKSYAGGGGNHLVPSATQNLRRKRIPLLDTDLHRNITSYGRRTLMSLGRHLYCAEDVVRGAIEELVEAATSSLVLESRSTDPDFKSQVEAWTAAHDHFCDIAGPPYSMATYRPLLARACFLDGDVGTLYVRGQDGLPYLQVIPSHRIGSDSTTEFVEGGPLDGAAIIDGVIVGDQMQPLAYRVLTGSPMDYTQFVDVPADRMKLHLLPLFTGQVRGLSIIGLSAWNWQDRNETKRWEMLAQKAGAGRVFQIWNENGEPPPGSDCIIAPGTGDATASSPSGLWYEIIDEGLNNYWKSSDPSSKMEAIKFDRPSSNQAAFSESVIREGLYAAGWSIDFGLLPTKVGGASLRVLVDKLNATLGKLARQVIEPAIRRFDAFRIPVAMLDLKRIKFAADWDAFEYQPAARLTADRKYDSDVTVQEVKFGLKSRDAGAMERGESHEDILASNSRSVRRLFAEAQAIAKEFDLPFPLVLDRLEQATPNGTPLPPEPAPGQGNESEPPEPKK